MSEYDQLRKHHFDLLKRLAAESGLENQADPADGPDIFVAHSDASGTCVVLTKDEGENVCLSLFFSSVTSGYGDPGDEDDGGDSAPALVMRSMCPRDGWEFGGESLDGEYPHALIELSKTLGLDRPHDKMSLDGETAGLVAKCFFRHVKDRR